MDMVAFLLLRTIMSTFILLLDFCIKPKAHHAHVGVTQCTVNINQSPSHNVLLPDLFFFSLLILSATLSTSLLLLQFKDLLLPVLLAIAQVAHFFFFFSFGYTKLRGCH